MHRSQELQYAQSPSMSTPLTPAARATRRAAARKGCQEFVRLICGSVSSGMPVEVRGWEVLLSDARAEPSSVAHALRSPGESEYVELASAGGRRRSNNAARTHLEGARIEQRTGLVPSEKSGLI